MSTLLVATHNGPFHADDVLGWALLNVFLPQELTLVRTRDKAEITNADIVLDVGGIFDAETRRFDHHQATYTGPRSSAGMTLDWLEQQGHIETPLADELQRRLVEYVDAVDNGRTAPLGGIPCFPSIIDALNGPADTLEEFDAAFVTAGAFAIQYVSGLAAMYRRIEGSKSTITAAMASAVERNSRVIELEAYHKWKAVYFAHEGETHPTDFVLFPSNDGTWRIVAIPPKFGDFGQKRPLPEPWAGLSGEALAAVTGIPGSMFCHKNRFIVVFETKADAHEAIKKFGLG